MSFFELLKIEFMKVKRGRIVPLIFIAPFLVVVSGVANLSMYFTPEYTNAWPAMFIQSALVYRPGKKDVRSIISGKYQHRLFPYQFRIARSYLVLY